ncbi:2-oxo acid dehydrogenase subunit E2 [Salinarimonas rosea]|uniref:2-oxo acid dehydrogenase subunit E2 n=1 Tax=Salinarimonas rosea TaxID=552063 RepID=UPI00040E53D5|nr:2-oxo acid dehydrogenase subunit E2 [Salinarimonas rosea]
MTDVIASPSVRAHAGRNGVDIDALGLELGRGSIAREDVDRKLSGATAPAAPTARPAADAHARHWSVEHEAYGPVTREPLSRFAKVSAAAMAAAQARIPAVTHHDRADVGALETFRTAMKGDAAARGVRLTALAFHVKALARALEDFPRFNASLSEDGETLVLKHWIDIGIAVDAPHGLSVPVVRGVDRKGLWRIAEEIADLAARAQARKLRPAEMGGAGMTISNLGGIGGSAFTPIVNPPEVAILGLTRTEIVPVWDGERFLPRPMVPLDLSYDHRVIDGADAARFLAHYARLIEDPRRLL